MNRKDSIFETKKYAYNFQKFETLRSFAKNIFSGKTTLKNVDEAQCNLLVEIIGFNKNTKARDFKW